MGAYYQSVINCDWCGYEEATEPVYNPGDLADESDMVYNLGWFQGELQSDWVTLCGGCMEEISYCESCDGHYPDEEIAHCDDGEGRCEDCVEAYHMVLQDDILSENDKRTQYICDVHEVENEIFIDTPQVQWKL